MKTRHLRYLALFIIVLANISCDQVSKAIVRKTVNPNERIELLNDNFILTKVENKGAFLSLGEELPAPAKTMLLLLFPFVLLAFIVWIIMTNKALNRPTLLAFCFIIGGGIGNLYDRMIYGSVTDFFHIDLGLFRTGIFNMADVSIMVGMALIVLGVALRKLAPKVNSAENSELK